MRRRRQRGAKMESGFEFDAAGRAAEGERYYVYAFGKGKKRCIGQVLRSERDGLWAALADGEPLAWARSAEEAAHKLLLYAAARRPGIWLPAAEVSEVERRFAAFRKRIPRAFGLTEEAARRARDVPLERRGRLLADVDGLIADLQAQLLWWRKVRRELAAPARLVRLK